MLRTHYVSDVNAGMDGQNVTLAGWIDTIRDVGKIKFIILRDRTGKAQIVVKDMSMIPENMLRESVISIEGVVSRTKSSKDFSWEILPTVIKMLNPAEAPLPLDPNVESELETRLDNRFLDLRNPKIQAIFRIKDVIQRSFVRYFEDHGFVLVNVPSIVAASTEGGTDLFHVKYFEKSAYLSQSPQLYKQIMMATGLDKVIIQTPVFRAEKHNTTRHLNESTQMDIEIAFVEDEQPALHYIKEVVQFIYTAINRECKPQLELLGKELHVPRSIKIMTYEESLELLEKNGIKLSFGDDLTPEAERLLCTIHDPVIITKWPTDIRAFYSMPEPDNPKICRAYDMLLGGAEVLSGAQRIHKYDELVKEMKRRKLNPDNFNFYLSAFRYGIPPHAGWSFGLERLTANILGLKNIREAMIFPRDRTRMEP